MKLATREQFEKVVRRFEDVEIPEYNLTVRVQEMSGTNRDKFEVGVLKKNPASANGGGPPKISEVDPMFLRGKLLVLCIVDDAGKRLFKDNEEEYLSDIIPASAQGKLFAVAQRLNGLEATAVGDAAKNSEKGQVDDSPSDLPSPSEKPSLNS